MLEIIEQPKNTFVNTPFIISGVADRSVYSISFYTPWRGVNYTLGNTDLKQLTENYQSYSWSKSLKFNTPGDRVIVAEPLNRYGDNLPGEIQIKVKVNTIFHYPVDNDCIVTSPFGLRNGRPHNGIDLAHAKGLKQRPVYAIADGYVRIAVTTCQVGDFQCGGGYGNVLYIEHPSLNKQSRYAHLSDVYVKRDTMVNKGQLIALTGNTGRSFGDHLHFEIREDGLPQNPELFF